MYSNNIELSVIIPIYNVEKYIKECLDSISAQTNDRIEVLIIDDGSKDNSGNIALEYCQNNQYFKYFKKENGGLSDARNYGVSKAKGEYILFIDSDDYISKDAISIILENLKEKPDCLVFDIKYFWEDSDLTKISKGIFDVNSDIKGRLLASAPNAVNKIFKRELHEKYPEPVKRFYEDVATTPKLIAECENIIYLEKDLYFYRQRNGSIIYTYDERCLDIFLDFQEVFDFYKEKNLFDRYYSIFESLAVEHILLYSNRRFLKMPKTKELFRKSKEFIDSYFEKPLENEYYLKMSKNDKLFIKLAYNLHTESIKLIIKIKNLLRR